MQTKPVLLMPDDRHPADQAVTLPKKQRKSICILDEAVVGRISDGQHLYDDAAYVFRATDARPRQTEFNNAGVDVSPALNGCLGFTELDGEKDRVSWQFIDDVEVPAARGAPWSPPRP